MARAQATITAADTATGEPLESTAITYFDVDGASAFPLGSLYAANTGGVATVDHPTNGRGQVTRFAQYAGRATYKIGADTLAQPVTFDVEPEDNLALADDGVTITAGYRALARLRVATLEAKILDMGGKEYHVDHAANALGVTVNDGVGDPDAAVNLCLAAIAALPVPKGIVQFGPGIYKAVTNAVTWPSDVVVRGCGRGVTTIKHRDNTDYPAICLPITALRNNFGVVGLTIDGNRANNLDYDISEISIEANGALTSGLKSNSDCFIYDVEVKDFNKVAIAPGGTRTTVANCLIYMTTPTDPYASILPAASGGTTPHRYGGLYGINTSGATVCNDVLIFNCAVRGLRSAGITVGGRGVTIMGCRLKDNHRGDFGYLTPGSQLAPTVTVDTAGSFVYPRDVLILDTIIEDEAYGAYGGGMEFNSCTNVIVNGCIIRNQYNHGIAINSTAGPSTGITITNTVITDISRSAAAVSAGNAAIVMFDDPLTTHPQRGTRIGPGVSIANCDNLMYTAGDVDAFALTGITQNNNAAGWTAGAGTGTNYQSGGHIYIAGSGSAVPLPERVYMNNAATFADGQVAFAQQIVQASATGHGLRVSGTSTSASQYLLNIANGSGLAFAVYGTGQIQGETNAAATYALDVENTNATGRGLLVTIASTAAGVPLLNAVNGNGGGLLVFADGQTRFGGPANGQHMDLQSQSEVVTIASATATFDTVIQIPAGAIVKFVTARVTAVAATTASYSVGVAGATSRYGTGIADTLNNTSSSPPTDNIFTYTAATSIRITPNANATDSLGRVRITIWYETATAAIS